MAGAEDLLDFAALEARLKYHFTHQSYLQQALTHPSCDLSDDDGVPFNNQRLEFLGDAVLSAVLARAIYEKYPSDNEGELSRKRIALVRGETLARIAKKLRLGEHLLLGDSEKKQGGASLSSNLENVMEAVIGAMMLDAGFDVVAANVLHYWADEIANLAHLRKDPKTELQELVQGRGLALPRYEVTAQSGEAHAPVFTVTVQVDGVPSATGEGSSKKQAERAAAKVMLQQLQSNRD